MKIALLQYDVVWMDVDANLHKCSRMIDDAEDAELYLLPEMFSTGFCVTAADFDSNRAFKSIEWLKEKSVETGAAIGGSVAVEQDGKLFNRFMLALPDGSTTGYDKRHLFGDEKNGFTRGQSRVVIEWNGLKLMPQICYDLRFPVWSRGHGDYDLLVYSANWPEARIEQWDALLRARAIENQCYVAGINRVGNDPQCYYAGHSAVYNFRGTAVTEVAGNQECTLTTELDIEGLHKARERFRVLDDADCYKLDN